MRLVVPCQRYCILDYCNGQHADEAAIVGRKKSGQLDGTAITAVGLSGPPPSVRPGPFANWIPRSAGTPRSRTT